MNLSNYFLLGKIGKTKSFKGEVFFHFTDGEVIASLDELESLFLKIGGKIIEYPIEKLSFKNGGTAVVKFEGINNEEMAELLKNSEVYIPKDWIPEPSEDEFFAHDLIGCFVEDKTYGKLGKIDYIDRQSPQLLVYLQKEDKELFFPLVEQFIVKLDFKNKTLFTDLPAGILDINA